MCGAVASNIIWRYLFKSGTYEMELGVINYYFGIRVNWLTERWPLLTAIIIKNTIGGMGSSMVLYYAGICGISHRARVPGGPRGATPAAAAPGGGALRAGFSPFGSAADFCGSCVQKTTDRRGTPERRTL